MAFLGVTVTPQLLRYRNIDVGRKSHVEVSILDLISFDEAFHALVQLDKRIIAGILIDCNVRASFLERLECVCFLRSRYVNAGLNMFDKVAMF